MPTVKFQRVSYVLGASSFFFLLSSFVFKFHPSARSLPRFAATAAGLAAAASPSARPTPTRDRDRDRTLTLILMVPSRLRRVA